MLILATPDVLQAERVLKLARAVNPSIESAVRTHSEDELAFIRRHEVGLALMGEQELAAGLARYALDVYERGAVAVRAGK
jgi:CPA2 family monovalent cation:H+ antiporter-2